MSIEKPQHWPAKKEVPPHLEALTSQIEEDFASDPARLAEAKVLVEKLTALYSHAAPATTFESNTHTNEPVESGETTNTVLEDVRLSSETERLVSEVKEAFDAAFKLGSTFREFVVAHNGRSLDKIPGTGADDGALRESDEYAPLVGIPIGEYVALVPSWEIISGFATTYYAGRSMPPAVRIHFHSIKDGSRRMTLLSPAVQDPRTNMVIRKGSIGGFAD